MKRLSARIFILMMLCVVYNTGAAQSNIKASLFIEELITQTKVDEAALSAQILSRGNAPAKPANPYMYYQDSIGQYVVRNMREGLKTYNNIFRGTRNDSVYLVDSAGKRKMMSIAEAHRTAFKGIGPNGLIHHRIEKISADSLTISPAERVYITRQVDAMKNRAWGKHDFLTFTPIDADTIHAIFADRNRNWPEMYKRGINGFYSFSTPIFIRNGTYCFFYYGYSCGGLCGEGRFAIYKKENGKWVTFAILSQWQS